MSKPFTPTARPLTPGAASAAARPAIRPAAPIRHRPAKAAGLLLAGALLGACGGGGGGSSTATPAGPQVLALSFEARQNGSAAGCGSTLSGLGRSALNAELRDLRFYVSGVELVRADGSSAPLALDAVAGWQLPGTAGVALVDLENATGACAGTGTAELRSTVSGSVAAGSYRKLRFTVGVPATLNHSDYAAASAPLDVQAMAWSWQSGRKFLKIELNPAGGVVRPAPAAAASTFNVHLGATGCTGNPASGEIVACGAPNRMLVELDFDPATQKLVLDLDALLAGSDLGQDGGGPAGCMSGGSDPECPAVFSALGLQLGGASPGLPLSATAQQIFRAEVR